MSTSTRTLVKLLYLLGFLCLANCKWIDLSHTFRNDTLHWGTISGFEHKLQNEGPYGNFKFLSLFDYSGSEHVGTHLDAPFHFYEEAWTADEIPAERLVGDAVVVDISEKSAGNPDSQMTVEDLKKWEEKHGSIPDGSIVFVYTGWCKHWSNIEKYFGTRNAKDTAKYHFPGKYRTYKIQYERIRDFSRSSNGALMLFEV